MDGTRVPIPRDAQDYAVAFDASGRILPRVAVQRYLTDPAAWLRQKRADVAKVAVYQVERTAWNGRTLPVIRWREDPTEIES